MCVVDPAAAALDVERPCPTLERMLALGRVRPTQSVAVAGAASLAVLIGLCRKGFSRACCAREAAGSGAVGEIDVLLLTGPCADEALANMVARTARLLGERGVVVAHELSLDADGPLERALLAAGLVVEWAVHDLSGPCLVAFGVHRAGAAQACGPAADRICARAA